MHSYYIGIFHENFYVIVYHADCFFFGGAILGLDIGMVLRNYIVLKSIDT
jgi:hypothetical protein